ncbi:MAG: glycosyltransferase [Actinobacteria bacterium]|nr:glycosyltransferase [Actinomycetota bacterium]
MQTNTMVDYWILGIPVIASRLRTVTEMYDDSVIEYFEPRDARALADAIVRLHDEPLRRRELARNGSRAHETYGWAVQQATYLDVYERLLAPRGRGCRRVGVGGCERRGVQRAFSPA